MLPRDAHVHTEWSWDAPHGSMERACARAEELGLRSVAFTDHADFVTWDVSEGVADFLRDLGGDVTDGRFATPALDVDGYLACLERCRSRFPGLEITSGVELGEPHWYPERARALLRRADFDLVVLAQHSLPGTGRGHLEVSDAHQQRAPGDVVRDYLAETERMITTWDEFDVLAHIDYAARAWPHGSVPYRTVDFEDDYRRVLHVLATRERALEVNTRLPLDPVIIRWWREEGGTAISFGSDVHDAHFLGNGFDAAATLATDLGFGPHRDRTGFWTVR